MVDGRPLPNRFPFWGSPSLRPGRQGADVPADLRSLPLLGKPFIEAPVRQYACSASARDRFPFWGSPSLRRIWGFWLPWRRIRSLPLLGKPFIEAGESPGVWGGAGLSLPLLGKPFIEAGSRTGLTRACRRSLPLLGKPFIEARSGRPTPGASPPIASPSGEALH